MWILDRAGSVVLPCKRVRLNRYPGPEPCTNSEALRVHFIDAPPQRRESVGGGGRGEGGGAAEEERTERGKAGTDHSRPNVDARPELCLGVRRDAAAGHVAIDSADNTRDDNTGGVSHESVREKGAERGKTYNPPRRKMNKRRILRLFES